MAVLSKVRLLTNERLDLVDLLNIENLAQTDWLRFSKRFIVGGDASSGNFVVNGLDITNPATLISNGGVAATVNINVADSILFFTSGGTPGAFYVGPSDAAPAVVTLIPNTTTYISVSVSSLTNVNAQRAFWDEVKKTEFPANVDTTTDLKLSFIGGFGGFPGGNIPLAIITTGITGAITAIDDHRPLLFRLGLGGSSNNPDHSFSFTNRSELGISTLANPINPFTNGDKSIQTLKDWCDAVMTKLQELGGTPYWFVKSGSVGQATNLADVAIRYDGLPFWNPAGPFWTYPDIHLYFANTPITFTIPASGYTFTSDPSTLFALCSIDYKMSAETFNFTNGSTAVKASSNTEVLVGDWIKNVNDAVECYSEVSAVDVDGVNITLATNYAGPTVVNQTATRARPNTTLQVQDLDSASISRFTPFDTSGRIWLARRDGNELIVRQPPQTASSGPYFVIGTGAVDHFTCTVTDPGGNVVAGPALGIPVGLMLNLKTAHALTGGAADLSINGLATVPLKKHTNPGAGVSANANTGVIMPLVFDGTVFQDLSQ